MLLRAARELQLELKRSWMIGDSLRDILAGQNAECRDCILVRTGVPFDVAHFGLARPFQIADDLAAAAEIIIRTMSIVNCQ
jgi:D-glycero-D-manno-heptose 1,7-bisphosphate phosphatase